MHDPFPEDVPFGGHERRKGSSDYAQLPFDLLAATEDRDVLELVFDLQRTVCVACSSRQDDEPDTFVLRRQDIDRRIQILAGCAVRRRDYEDEGLIPD